MNKQRKEKAWVAFNTENGQFFFFCKKEIRQALRFRVFWLFGDIDRALKVCSLIGGESNAFHQDSSRD